MNRFVSDATDSRRDVQRRAVAHELSAEWHRKVGVRLGLAATILSTAVGTAVFAVVTAKLGLDGKGTLSIPSELWPRIAFYAVFALSILAPVLSASQLFLDDTGQATKHTSDSAKYYRVKERLDAFLRKFDVESLGVKEQESAQLELDEISRTIEGLRGDSLSLTRRAYKDADEQIGSSRGDA